MSGLTDRTDWQRSTASFYRRGITPARARAHIDAFDADDFPAPGLCELCSVAVLHGYAKAVAK